MADAETEAKQKRVAKVKLPLAGPKTIAARDPVARLLRWRWGPGRSALTLYLQLSPRTCFAHLMSVPIVSSLTGDTTIKGWRTFVLTELIGTYPTVSEARTAAERRLLDLLPASALAIRQIIEDPIMQENAP